MSWEAYRWTAKAPSELYHTLGPQGVDDLIRKALSTCWRNTPTEERTLAAAIRMAREVFERNVAVWQKIRKPEPEAFFADLQPLEADGFVRQAMVTAWMMMPRTGGREIKDALRIVRAIFDRNIAAWEEDDATFTGKASKKRAAAKKKPSAKRVKAPARKRKLTVGRR
jgi:hypothetical protein